MDLPMPMLPVRPTTTGRAAATSDAVSMACQALWKLSETTSVWRGEARELRRRESRLWLVPSDAGRAFFVGRASAPFVY